MLQAAKLVTVIAKAAEKRQIQASLHPAIASRSVGRTMIKATALKPERPHDKVWHYCAV